MKETNSKNVLLTAIGIVVIVVASFVSYSTSFGNEFLFDDISQIVNNDVIKSPGNISAVFTHHLTFFTRNNQEEGKFYRPLQSITLMLDHLLWGMETFGYHLTNTLLHALVGVLSFLFLLSVTKNTAVSFITSLLYAVHPIHTEAVTYISGRADSLCAVFLFLIALSRIRYYKSISIAGRAFSYFFIMVFFICALLSKEYSMVFPLLLVWLGYCFDAETGYSSQANRKIFFYLPFFAIIAVWFFIKNAIVSTETMVEEPGSLATRLTTMPRLIFDYVRLSFFPTGLHMGYKLEFPRSLLQTGYLGPFIFTMIFLGASYYVWFKGKTDFYYKIAAFGLGWFFIGLAPYLNLVFQLNAPFAEHWLYVPEMGLILSVVVLLYSKIKDVPWAKKIGMVLAIAVTVIFLHKTMEQNKVWKDSFTFYSYTVKYADYSETIYNNLAIEYVKMQRWDDAEKAFMKALEINPDYKVARDNLENMRRDNRRGI
ncbi:MAG TPA: tetratricopeptide repeat protein [Candidatus Omnitrophota bacterium]|nr:tetratricopeptide repeat protein [Candidatus Omnitrophota bacterium]